MSEVTAVAAIEPQSHAFFQVLSRAAADERADPDKMERLYAIHKDMKAMDARESFARSFVLMQPELPIITREGKLKTRGRDGREALNTNYARFEDIASAIRPVLASHGFGLQFKTTVQAGNVLIVGTIWHRDGHNEQAEMILPPDTTGGKNGVQSFGSTISYGKRYVMVALLNIITEGEDTDGNPPGLDRETGEIHQRTQPRATGAPALATDAQQRLIRARMSDAGMDAEVLKRRFNIEHLADLPFDQVNAALEFIRDPQAEQVGDRG